MFSHSRLSSYESCPRKYWYRYVEEVKIDAEGVEAFVGKRVHEVLERLYHHVQRHGRPPSLAQVYDRFRRDWKQHWHSQVRIVRSENDENFYVEHGERCLGNYYRGHYPFDQAQTLAVEHPITLALDDAGRFQMRGVIDRVVRSGPGCYEVHDYKTGASMPPRWRLDRDRQLALYQIGLEQSYPDAEQVELVWHYLAFNKTIRQRRTSDEMAELRRETIGLIEQIELAREFPARPSALCRWCEYQDLCPAARGDTLGEDAPEAFAAPPAAIPPARPRGQLSLL